MKVIKIEEIKKCSWCISFDVCKYYKGDDYEAEICGHYKESTTR